MNKMWDFCLFIELEQDISDHGYHGYQKQVCKFLFLLRTVVKTNRNLMCDYF